MIRKFTRVAAASLGLAAAAVLAGCVSLLPESEPRMIYRLAAPDATQEAESRLEDAATLVVREPIAPRALSGNRIALMREGRIVYMSGADWISPVPRMLHAMILDAFHADAGGVAAATISISKYGVSRRSTIPVPAARRSS